MKELNTTENKIYKKNYIACLNWLSYFYEEMKVNENKQKAEQRKIK